MLNGDGDGNKNGQKKKKKVGLISQKESFFRGLEITTNGLTFA